MPISGIEEGGRPWVTHPNIDPKWLDQAAEPELEMDLPIVDAHHHLWDRGTGYFVPELLNDLTQVHRVVATVHVQCHHGYLDDGPTALRPIGETRFAVRMADLAQEAYSSLSVCAGIVGFADLQLGDAVEEVLQAHIVEGRGRFRGIRRLNAQDGAFRTHLPPTEPGLLADSRFRRGFAHLERHGLSFDAWMYHPQLDELCALADAFPRTVIVLNHAGTPLGIGPYKGRQREVFEAWSARISRLAERANVVVKLGGFGMVFNGFDFYRQPMPPSSQALADAWRPYVEHCIEAFGANRCMFESNFPVDKASFSYRILWNAFKRLTAGASKHEKAALFGGTAARIYRLDVPELTASAPQLQSTTT